MLHIYAGLTKLCFLCGSAKDLSFIIAVVFKMEALKPIPPFRFICIADEIDYCFVLLLDLLHIRFTPAQFRPT